MTLSANEPLRQAARWSRFLHRLLESQPGLADEVAPLLARPLHPGDLLAWLHPENLDETTLKPALRRLRARVMAHVACRDLTGLADLEEVTGAMTLLADTTVDVALAVHRKVLVARHGEPRGHGEGSDGAVQDFLCIGMGKLGGGELNVSSDVDFIFAFPEDGETDGASRLSNFEFFTRLGRRLIDALADVTGDGFVFRVDMRLRPNGDSGPLVASLDMLEHYFIAQGREWERYAWIKARQMTGAPCAALEAIRRPFVFRKYLDFGAINAMRDLHAQIRREVARRDMADHIKLGPGGIREIEFIAQVFQLIRGGRDPALQIRPTLQVLALLAQRQTLSAAAVAELTAAYRFLRKLEHRLQYLDDAQTHRLPEDAADQAVIAAAMGFASYAALLEELDDHRGNVSRHFDAVFADPTRNEHALATVWACATDLDACTGHLARLGYRDPAAAAARLSAVQTAPRYQHLPAGIRTRFDALVPQVIQAAADTADPDTTLARTLDLLETISRRGAYLALLQQYPAALAKLCHMVAASRWAAEYLMRHPILLDELLDPRLLDAEPDWPAFKALLADTLAGLEPDTERQMDLMREQHHAQVFRLLARDLAGRLTVERLSDHLSLLADIVLDLTLQCCWRKLRTRHRESPRFAVIAYGKLGGKELGYASDLDIIFLYDDDAPEAQENYARLAQRMLTWLSSRTPAGMLFETDTRLRPNGEAGLLVSSLDGFAQYQADAAWVWEHQALTRARFCAGDAAIGERFEALRHALLRKPRDTSELRREVLAMRQKMREAHAAKSELFDLKHDAGGLIDVEFMVQYLVLAHAPAHRELTGNLGNIALLRIAGELGLIPAELAARTGDAYREYRRLQHGLRLNGEAARVDPSLVATEREAVTALWARVFEA